MNPEQEFKTKFLVTGKTVLTLCDMPSSIWQTERHICVSSQFANTGN
jgi:hypothetical protein